MVDFAEIPSVNKSPAVFAELDPIGAPGTDIHTMLFVGYRLSSAEVPALTPVLTTGDTEGDGQHGAGSQLARMLRGAKRVNRTSRMYSVGIAEPSAGAAAAGTFTVTGTATADGELALYVGGDRVAVAVESGDDATAIATKIAAALNANGQLPVTGSSALGVATATCRWKGLSGLDIHLGVDLRDADRAVPGVSVAVAAMAGGTGSPDLAAVVAILEERRYDAIVLGDHGANLGDMVAEIERRWGATVMLDGHVWIGMRGNVGAMAAFGDGLNSPALTVLGIGLSPSAPWIAAAQAAAQDGMVSNPGLPRFGLPLPDVAAPAPADRLDHAERNLLLVDGISTVRVDSGGRTIIDRLVTTYQENDSGGEDDAWEALTTRHKASYLRRDWVAYIQARYPRHMLADDGTVVDPGVPVVTPSVIKGEALAWYQEKMRQGHVDNFDAFRASLVANRPDGDPTRVDALLEPHLTNELVTIATRVAFRI